MSNLNTPSKNSNDEIEIRALRMLQEVCRGGALGIVLAATPENWPLKKMWIEFGGHATFANGEMTLRRKITQHKVRAA